MIRALFSTCFSLYCKSPCLQRDHNIDIVIFHHLLVFSDVLVFDRCSYGSPTANISIALSFFQCQNGETFEALSRPTSLAELRNNKELVTADLNQIS